MKNEFLSVADEYGRLEMQRAIENEHGLLPVQRIGRSLMGKDINAYFIGKGRRRVAFFGAHHASEHITCNVLFAFMDDLLHKAERRIGDAAAMLSLCTYVVVPMVNPDGAELAIHGIPEQSPLRERQMRMACGEMKKWNSNARGVDLNHNYDYRFLEYKERERELNIEAGRSLFSGSYPESEPESRAVAALVRALSPEGIISLHTQGEEIFYKPENELCRRLAGRAREFTGYTVSVPEGTASYGGLVDYTGGVLGIPSLTLELGRGENPLAPSSLSAIYERIAPLLLAFPRLL